MAAAALGIITKMGHHKLEARAVAEVVTKRGHLK
jgi:hypothetical protein